MTDVAEQKEFEEEALKAAPAPSSAPPAAGQLGVLRYVQLVYFAMWVLLAFIMIKVGGGIWEQLYESYDSVPEPNSIILSLSSAVLSLVATVAMYRAATVNDFITNVCIEL